MTENEFGLCLVGQGNTRTPDGQRLRYIVEEEASKLAGELRRGGRPDKASRMAYIGSQLRIGKAVSKRVVEKASKDLDVLRDRLIDGQPAASPPYV